MGAHGHPRHARRSEEMIEFPQIKTLQVAAFAIVKEAWKKIIFTKLEIWAD
jgi:hypothetical protein